MKASRISFVLKVREEKIGEIKEIAGELTNMGCRIENILPLIGVISGSAPANIDPKELKIEGIKYVEINKKVKTK